MGNINFFNLMSQVKTIDGQTGELVGGSNTYGYTQVSSSNAGYGNTIVSGGNVGYTTTTTTQPVQYTTTTTAQQPVTTYATSSNVVGGSIYFWRRIHYICRQFWLCCWIFSC